MQVIGMRRMPRQHLHGIFDALASATYEIGVVLLAYAGGFGLSEYSQSREPVQNRPEVHRRAGGLDDLRLSFDDTHANSGLCETESIDEADWPATDDYHVFHMAVFR